MDRRGLVNGLGPVARGRRGLTNGLTNGLVNGTRGRTNGLTNGLVNGLRRGRTNGLTNGLVNGTRGRINGTRVGRVNGLVNGSGYTNGLPLRGNPFGIVTQRDLVTGTRLVVAALVGLFLLPLLLAADRVTETPPVTVDGLSGDWPAATRLALPPSGAPLQVAEVGWQPFRGQQFWLLGPAAAPFAGSGIESYLVAVDEDGDAGTGLRFEGLGVDSLIQATGWEGEVREATFTTFEAGAGLDYNARHTRGPIAAAAGPGGIELHTGLEGLGPGSPFRARVLAVDSGGRSSLFPAILSDSPAALLVRQSEVPPAGTSGDVLRLELTALRGTVEVRSLDLAHAGGGRLVPPATPFSVPPGETVTRLVALDRTGLPAQTLVRVELRDVAATAPAAVSGEGALFYVTAPPGGRVVDGLFDDWTSSTPDALGDAPPSADLAATASDRDGVSAFFLAAGTAGLLEGRGIPVVPTRYGPPAQAPSEGGSAGVRARRTGEDLLRIYVDSDSLSPGGESIHGLEADRLVEVRGIRGRVTSAVLLVWDGSGWAPTGAPVLAEARSGRVEVSVALAALGVVRDPKAVIVLTAWNGRTDVGDLLTGLRSGTRGTVEALPRFSGAGDNAFLVTGTNDFALDAATKRIAMRFSSRQSLAVTEVRAYVGAVVGTPPSYRVGLQEDATGLPSGTYLCSSAAAPTGAGWLVAPCVYGGYADKGVYHLVVSHNFGTVDASNHARIRSTTPNNQRYPLDQQADENMDVLEDSGAGVFVAQGRQPVYVVDDGASYEGNPYHGFAEVAVFGNSGVGDKFSIGADSTYNRGRFHVRKVGSPGGDLVLKLRDVGGGTELRSVSVPASSIGGSYTWLDFNFASVALSAGTTYALYLQAPSGTDAANYFATPVALAEAGSPYQDLGYDGTTTFRTTVDLGCGSPPCFTDAAGDDTPFALLPEIDPALVAAGLPVALVAPRVRRRLGTRNLAGRGVK